MIAICKTCTQEFDANAGHDCPGLQPKKFLHKDSWGWSQFGAEYLGVDLIPPISNAELEEMLEIIKPIKAVAEEDHYGQAKADQLKFYEIDVTGVDRRGTAFTWSPKLKEEEIGIAWRNGMQCTIPTFHTYGAPCFFKPTLAETYAAIRARVPDWRHARWVWQRQIWEDSRDIFGNYHIGLASLFGRVR